MYFGKTSIQRVKDVHPESGKPLPFQNSRLLQSTVFPGQVPDKQGLSEEEAGEGTAVLRHTRSTLVTAGGQEATRCRWWSEQQCAEW